MRNPDMGTTSGYSLGRPASREDQDSPLEIKIASR